MARSPAASMPPGWCPRRPAGVWSRPRCSGRVSSDRRGAACGRPVRGRRPARPHRCRRRRPGPDCAGRLAQRPEGALGPRGSGPRRPRTSPTSARWRSSTPSPTTPTGRAHTSATRPAGTALGFDHGLTMHAEPRLRTALWGGRASRCRRWRPTSAARRRAGGRPGRRTARRRAPGRRPLPALRERTRGLLDRPIHPEPSGPGPASPGRSCDRAGRARRVGPLRGVLALTPAPGDPGLAPALRLFDTAAGRSVRWLPARSPACTSAESPRMTPPTSGMQRPMSPSTWSTGCCATPDARWSTSRMSPTSTSPPRTGRPGRRGLAGPRRPGDRPSARTWPSAGAPAGALPRVVDSIPYIVDVVARLLEAGTAYRLGVAEGSGADVYLDVAPQPQASAR